MIRKIFRNFLTTALVFGLLVSCVPAVSAAEEESCDICGEIHATMETESTDPDELRDLMNSTYSAALKKSGLRNFYNRCSTLVNTTLQCLGIIDSYISCHGKGEYDVFKGMKKTDAGYGVNLYPATSYSLKGALNAISQNGTKDVYNIVLGWQSGSTYASRYYGHTCFIYAILDGTVYFIDNFAITIDGKYYKAGEVVTCTIEQFAASYDRWAKFEGAVHFTKEDTKAPTVSEYARVSDVSSDGFTLTYDATDNVQITSVYAKVWIAGGSEEQNYVIVDGTVEDGVASIRVDAADFDGYQGEYYVTCYTGDGVNQPSVTVLAEESVCLYQTEACQSYFRVSSAFANVYSVPQTQIGGQTTKILMLPQNSIRLVVASFQDQEGIQWYQLDAGGWIMASDLTEDLNIPTQWPDFIANILNWFLEMGLIGTT